MENLLEIDKLQLIIILPGFISLKIWKLLIPSHDHRISDYFIETICYSAINFSFLFWLIPIANQQKGFLFFICYLIIMIVAPCIWPFLWKLLITCKLFKGHLIHPTQKAWDYYFGLGNMCFMLIHLKNGNLIGGLYYKNSFASSYPENQDLYLKEVWKINKKGEFISKIDRTDGMLITYDVIDYIELFKATEESRSVL